VQITSSVVRRPDSTFPLIIRPYKLDLSQFAERVRDQIKFKITNVSDSTIDLSLIAQPSELMDVTLPKTIAPGQTAEGLAKLKKGAVSKTFSTSFTLEANDASKSRFTIPIKREIRLPGQAADTAAGTQIGSH